MKNQENKPTKPLLKSKKNNNFVDFILSIGIGLFFLITLLIMFSMLMINKDIAPKLLPFFMIIASVVSAFVSGFYLSRKIKFRGVIAGFISGLPLLLICLAILTIINKGKINSLPLALFLLTSISGILGGILSANTRKRFKN